MPTKIFYTTGTGNSLWIAKAIAEKTGQTELQFMSNISEEKISVAGYDTIGFVFPVYIWGVPQNVLTFVNRLTDVNPAYCFAVAVNGSQVANTLVQFKKYLKERKIALDSGFDIVMPSNYIPWGGPGPVEKQQARFQAASAKIGTIADIIRKQEKRPVEKGPLWHRILFTLFYKMSTKYIHVMDGNFWVDDKCNSCKICEQVCPTRNILMVDGRPAWNHKCDQCYACLQWCPQQAIQYGKKTPQYERYHHPEIKLKDIIK